MEVLQNDNAGGDLPVGGTAGSESGQNVTTNLNITNMTSSDLLTGETDSSNSNDTDGKFVFAVDRGGTFTDVWARCPSGRVVVLKLLSEDPKHYRDAPTEAIRRVLQQVSEGRSTIIIRRVLQ